jgi:Arc/MetJ family transcription regulator
MLSTNGNPGSRYEEYFSVADLAAGLKVAHSGPMRRNVTPGLDVDLAQEASAELGTRRTGETVHAALCEVVRSDRRTRLLDLSTDPTLDDLRTLRVTRFSTPESRGST